MSKSTPSTVESDETTSFPVFQRALRKYFPDKAIDMIENYHRVGESSIEFTGLLEEIRTAVAHPARGAAFLNAALGTDLTEDEAEEQLIELHDQLARSGVFSDEYIEAEIEKQLAEKATPDELMGYYLTRRIEFRGPLSKFSAPIWIYPAASIVLAIALAVMLGLIPHDMFGAAAISTIFTALIAVCVLIIFASAVAMNGLRGERLHPEREREKEREYRESKDGDKPKRRSAFSRMNPFK